MQLVQSGQSFSFNYTDPYQRSGLFVAFSIYDVTSSPILVETIDGIYAANGSYMAAYEGTAGHTYVLIGAVYTDNTYSVIDTTAGQIADVFYVISSSSSVINFGFAYASYDYSNTLHLRANIWNVTTGSPVSAGTASMINIADGVYYGSYAGAASNSYSALAIVYTDGTFSTPNPSYAPASPSFTSITLPISIVVEGNAHLIGQGQGQQGIITVNPPIHFTQGDNVILNLIAVDVYGNPVSLTGATFSTQISGSNGAAVNVFGNSQHAANVDQINFTGYFTLTLGQADTLNCGENNHKEILTTISIGGNQVYFRGFNALQVYAPTPFE